MTLKYLIQKEFLQIRRNGFLPKLIVAFPIVIMCVMPWVMNMEVKNIRVNVVDCDRTPQSQRLVHALEASRYFVFQGQQPTYQAALAEVEHGRSDVILEIRDGRYLIAANAVNGTKGAMGSAYLAQIVSEKLRVKSEEFATAGFSGECRVQSVEFPAGVPSGDGTAVANSPLSTHHSPLTGTAVANSSLFTFHSSLLYNPHQSYKLFMIPALLAIVMMLMTGFLPTLNIVGEKEAGTIEQINVTPVSKWAFILAKLIPYWLIALFVVTVCLLLAWAVYGITPAGSVGWIYVLAMLLALFFSSFGLIVSNYSDTMQQAIFVMWFFVVCLMLLSGLFTPTRSMPDWAYLSTYVNPMHYFIDAVRTVFIRGGGFADIAHQLLALTGIGLLMGCWAVVSYKKNS